MTDKLKDLFSPERLRDSWCEANAVAAAPEEASPGGDLLETYELFVKTLQARFPGRQGVFAEQLLVELKELFDRLLYGDAPEAPAADVAAVPGEIVRRLRVLEDLLDCKLALPAHDA